MDKAQTCWTPAAVSVRAEERALLLDLRLVSLHAATDRKASPPCTKHL